MINIQGKLPYILYVACSGGVDSMAIVDFLRRKHQVTLLFVDHDTETSSQAKEFLKKYIENNNKNQKNKLGFFSFKISDSYDKSMSLEEFWRNERYKIFQNFYDSTLKREIITCHHLNDCVETWIWSSLHGEGKIIPYRNKNVIRPFRLTPKRELVSWARRNNVPWIEDESNKDTNFTRNYIRHIMMPHVFTVNPGIEKVVKKKIENDTSWSANK